MGRAPLILVVWKASRTIPLVLLLLAGLNVFFHLYAQTRLDPQVESLKAEMIERQDYLRRLEQNSVQEGDLPQLLYKNNLGDFEQFQSLLPPKAEFTGLIGELFELASEANLEIQRVSYDPEIDKETSLLKYTLSFSVSGGYGDIKKFIYLVEHSPRLFIIDDLSLAGVEGEAQIGAVSLRLRMTTYFKTDPS